MPALCRAGVLVQCCAPTHRAEKESRGCPDGCPNGCPDQLPDKGPGDTDPSDKGDCSSCADVCNLVSLDPQKTAGKDFENTVAPVVPTTEARTSGLPSAPYAFPGFFNRWPYENLPFPASDRPLLI
ncbi:MAG: hypothetical protein ACYTFA_13555 [Planctomycetota bacterium]|jgi:hypothetical protein